MYNTVKSSIRYQNLKTDPIHSFVGVKQGDPASSLLCLFYLNDVLDDVNSRLDGIINTDGINIFLLLFADDAALLPHDPVSLQSLLNDLETYSNKNKLRLNVAKTKIMIFEKGRHTNYDFFLYNTPIEVVKSFKYLGVFFYKNGNWNRTQKRLAQHASMALHNLFIIFNQTELPFQQKLQLFDSLVSSILNYSSKVWGTHVAPDIELIHTKFCRKILNVKQSTNRDALFGELGRVPMYIHRKITMIKYWIKILNQNENSLLHKTYIMLKNDVLMN